MWFELTPAPRTGDDSTFQQDAKTMADMLMLTSRPGWLDWWHHDDGLRLVAQGDRRWVEISDRLGERAARAVAKAAHAIARPCDEPADVLDAPIRWAHAFVPITATLARNARDDAPSVDDTRFTVDEDTVIVLTVRRLGWIESMRNTDWVADEMNRQADTSKLRAPGLGACRVMAGADTTRQAIDRAAQAANALNLGFVPGLNAHRSRPGLLGLLAAITLAGMGIGLWAVDTPPLLPLLLFAIAVMLAWRWWRRHDDVNDIDQRPRHRWWFTRMRRARDSDLKTTGAGDDGNASKRLVHAYAFQRSTLPLPPGALAVLATPPADRTAMASAPTLMPRAMTHADGPLIGMDADKQPVHLWAAAMYGGIALFGEPGGGKSNLMHGILAWQSKHHTTGDMLIDFESKGVDSTPILDRLAPGMRLIDINDPDTPMIGLLSGPDHWSRAGGFAALMRGALGDTQIGPQSRIQLRDSVFLALEGTANPDLARRCRAEGVTPPDTWVMYAARLLARDGVRDARALGRATRMTVDTPAVAAALERLHGGVDANTGRPRLRDGELAQLLRAPMNKMDILASATRVFQPGRKTLDWHAIARRADRHADARVIINLGAAIHPTPDGTHPDLDDDARRLIGALLLRSLKEEIASTMGGWQSNNRHARILIDELTDVSGTDGANADVLAWMREKGRAYGVELTVGTQNLGQLAGPLLDSVTSYMTVASFVLRADATSTPAAAMIGVDRTIIEGLPRHTLAVRTVGTPPDLAGQPAMIVTVPHFDDGRMNVD